MNRLMGPQIELSILLLLISNNGHRTEWSLIEFCSASIRVIRNTGRPRNKSQICLIASLKTDRFGAHEVLLPINHNYNKILLGKIGLMFKFGVNRKMLIAFTITPIRHPSAISR